MWYLLRRGVAEGAIPTNQRHVLALYQRPRQVVKGQAVTFEDRVTK
jgi:hypothetical protein